MIFGLALWALDSLCAYILFRRAEGFLFCGRVWVWFWGCYEELGELGRVGMRRLSLIVGEGFLAFECT